MELVFRALQDETRRRILDLLKKGSLNAGEISEHFSMSKPSISYHLDLLRQGGLVSVRKEGQFVEYTLEATVLDEALAWMMDLYEKKHALGSFLGRPGTARRAVRRARGGVE